MKNLKDTLTNILSVVTVIIGAASAYFQQSTDEGINWAQLGIAIVVAIVAWFTGKKPNGTT